MKKVTLSPEHEEKLKEVAKLKDKPWYVYIIECHAKARPNIKKDKERGFFLSYYTGVTNNPWNRFKNHANKKGARYTRRNKPVKFVLIEQMPDKSSALKREKEIKLLYIEEKELLISQGSVPEDMKIFIESNSRILLKKKVGKKNNGAALIKNKTITESGKVSERE